MANFRSTVFSVAGVAALIVAVASTHPQKALGAAAPQNPLPAPSIPAQECGGAQSGSNGMIASVNAIAGPPNLWERDTMAIFLSGDPGGASYMSALGMITSNPQPAVPESGNGATMQAQALQTAAAQLNLTQSLHFASIHLTGQYTGKFRCIGLSAGTYYVVGSFYRNSGSNELKQQYAAYNINVAGQPTFQPTYYYRILVPVANGQNATTLPYATVPPTTCNQGAPAAAPTPMPPASTKCWEFMGVHPIGFRQQW